MTDQRPPARRALLAAGLAAAGTAALGRGAAAKETPAKPALAQPGVSKGLIEWRMATAWPKGLPGTGESADRIAERIGALSGGRLTVKVFAAGELAPAFEVFDVVSSGGAQMGHAAGAFWAGKRAAAPLFTSAPFGLTPWEHLSWIEAGGGQTLWERLYADFGVRPFLAGNTGPSMGGWFRREIRALDDLKGLKMRIAGIGGGVMQALGVATQAIPPAEIFAALQSGVVDAAEFAGPAADAGLGLDQAAKLYYGPGFHEPNGAAEALVSQKAYDALSPDLQAIVAAACREEHAVGLGFSERANAAALNALVKKRGVILKSWPEPVMTAARLAAKEAFASLASVDGLSAEIVQSYDWALERARRNTRSSYLPFLKARG